MVENTPRNKDSRGRFSAPPADDRDSAAAVWTSPLGARADRVSAFLDKRLVLTRRDALMLNAAFFGAIVSGAATAAPPELPVLVDGLQGWVSTSRGRFLFGDGTTLPAHGKSVHEARNVQDQTVLFNQATPASRPTWDTTTFDVPCIRSNGTQYLTRATALPAPGLVIVGCAFNSGATGFHALTGARSSATPGGDAREDAWHLNKASNNQMRGLTATTSDQMFADTPQILGEKLLVMLEIVGDALQVWQVGSTGEQTIIGTRIAPDGEQALLAKYFDDSIVAIMQGAIFEFAQYAPAPSRSERRLLVQYFQGLIWPGASPPVAATVNAGQIPQGATGSVDVVTPSAGQSRVLASIDEQPPVGLASVSGNDVAISVPAGAALGNYNLRYCLRSNVTGTRLVDFGRVDFEVVESSGEIADLPYGGQLYGCAYWGATAGNSRLRAGPPDGESWFFRPWRTGTITGLHWHVRSRNADGSGAPSGYSAGNGGTYTLQIRPADPVTKRPVPGSAAICELTGYQPGNPTTADRHIYPTLNFTTTGQVVAGQPYCVVAINTAGSGNYVSMNTNNAASFWEDEPEPSNYTEPARGGGTSGVVVASGGTEADQVGATAVRVAGWAPTRVGGISYDPYAIHTQDGILRGRCLGAGFYELIYSDGVVSQNGAWGSEGDYKVDVNGSNQFRLRFRPSRGNVTVSGVYIRSSRNGTGAGNIVVTLEQGPDTDAHFPNSNGTQIAQASCNVNLFLDCGTSEQISQIDAAGSTMELVHWVWIPFGSPVTLQNETWYTVRLSATGSAFLRYWGTGRGEGTPGFGVDGRLSTWAQWKAGRQIAREGFDDCRDGSEISADGGATWAAQPGGARMHPILFRCV